MTPPHVFTLDRGTRLLLAAITALLAVIAVELWAARPPLAGQAQAQIPDSGLQRNVLIDEARRTNQLLADILNHLQNKPVKVKPADTDKPEGRSESGRR